MGERHQQAYFVSLDKLHGVLWAHEGDKDVQYEINLETDRADCVIERRVFEPEMYGLDELGRIVLEAAPMEHRTAILTLDQLCARAPHDVEWARSSHVVWAARGMWGIPLEFGLKPETESQISLP